MKTLSFIGSCLIFSSFILFTSCKKETVTPNSSNVVSSDPPAGPTISTMNLVVYSWQDNKDGTYSSDFNNIFDVSSVEAVYAIWNGIRYPILNEVPFLGGYLKATVKDKSLKMSYRFSGSTLPFSSLPIIVILRK